MLNLDQLGRLHLTGIRHAHRPCPPEGPWGPWVESPPVDGPCFPPFGLPGDAPTQKLNLVNREEATRELAMCDPVGGGGCIPPGSLGTGAGHGTQGDDGGSLGGTDGADCLGAEILIV